MGHNSCVIIFSGAVNQSGLWLNTIRYPWRRHSMRLRLPAGSELHAKLHTELYFRMTSWHEKCKGTPSETSRPVFLPDWGKLWWYTHKTSRSFSILFVNWKKYIVEHQSQRIILIVVSSNPHTVRYLIIDIRKSLVTTVIKISAKVCREIAIFICAKVKLLITSIWINFSHSLFAGFLSREKQ